MLVVVVLEGLEVVEVEVVGLAMVMMGMGMGIGLVEREMELCVVLLEELAAVRRRRVCGEKI